MFGRRRLFVTITALALVVSACGDDDADTGGDSVAATEADVERSDPPAASADGPADVGASGLQVSGVEFGTGTAVLVNVGGEVVDLSGHWICNRPGYDELPAVELAPGEGVQVAVPGIDRDGGEVAIYSGSDFGNSDTIVSYVQWGSGGGRARVAEDAGIWTGDPVDVAGEGISLIGAPGAADGWE